jgi:hypothetical protein
MKLSHHTRRTEYGSPERLNFPKINRAALVSIHNVLAGWLPDGRRQGNEWVARNPTRADRTTGSFKVNLGSGRWSDFATGDRGGDLISLVAYLSRSRQSDAALQLKQYLGI